MKYVLDTNVIIAGIRSPKGATAEILRRVLKELISIVCSVPLFLEYEAVLLRPEQLTAAGLCEKEILNFLDVLAGVLVPIEIQFLWRPQLKDPNDDVVLELVVNALGIGDRVCIITFHQTDFSPQINKFDVRIKTPKQFFQGE